MGRMRVGIVTLGCDKNTVDNEYLAGLLEAAGCELVIEAGPHEALDTAKTHRLEAGGKEERAEAR